MSSWLNDGPRDVDGTRPTARQLAVLRFVVEAGAPTVREVMDHFGFTSTNAVSFHFAALIRRGLLERGDQGKSRDVKATEAGLRVIGRRSCPHCDGAGTVRA